MRVWACSGLALVALTAAVQAAPRHHTPPSKPAPPPAPPHVIPEQGTLTHDDLVAVAELKRKASQTLDEFSADPVAKFVGRSFEITLPLDHSGMEHKYDAAQSKLTLGFEQYLPPRIPLASRTVSAGAYEGQNAFGAKRQVYSQTSESSRIDGTAAIAFQAVLDAPPDNARALWTTGTVTIDGVIAAPGVECSIGGVTPTIDVGLDITDRYCAVKAKITHIAVHSTTGASAADWAAPPG